MIKAFKPEVETTPVDTTRSLRSTCSTTSIYGTDVVASTNKSVIENISRHVVYGELNLFFQDCLPLLIWEFIGFHSVLYKNEVIVIIKIFLIVILPVK